MNHKILCVDLDATLLCDDKASRKKTVRLSTEC